MLTYRKMLYPLFFITLFLFGCSESSNQENSKKDKGDEYTSELRIAVNSNPASLDPHMTTAADALEISRNFFETLLSLDENYEPQPMLAESYEISDDGLTYTFILREGVHFHNGNEMTADDVAASMNRWLASSSRARSLLKDASFDVKDKYSVTLTLSERASDTLDLLAASGQFPAIMPKEIIEAAGEDGASEYIGTGPFKFKEIKQDSYVHLVKNEDYNSRDEASSGLVGKKEVFFDDLYYEIVSDPTTKIAGLQTGEYDIADRLAFEYYDQVVNNPDFENHVNTDNGTLNLFFNKKAGLMQDKLIRQAVNAALNVESVLLASYSYEDLYEVNPSYMSPNHKLWGSEAGAESYNQGDPEKAKQLLAEAGYNGETVTLLSTRDYEFHYNTAIVVKEQLEKIGMNVELDIYDWPTLIENRDNPENWDLLTVSFTHNTTPSQLLYFNPEYPGWLEDKKVHQLLDELRAAEDQEDASATWDELQAYMYNDYVPHVMFGHTSVIIATSKNLEGFKVFNGPIPWNTKVKEN